MSRPRLLRTVAPGLLTAACAVVGFACAPADTSGPVDESSSPVPSTSPPTSPGTASDSPRERQPPGVPRDAQSAVVRDIVDGDTLVVESSAGGALSGGPVDVRLIGVDTPEVTDCFAEEATAQLAALAPIGSTVWAQRDEELLDRYERHLSYLWNETGTFVNLALVASGHADAVAFPPNVAHREALAAAAGQARVDGAGRWGVCATPSPPTSPSIEEVVPPQPPSEVIPPAAPSVPPPPEQHTVPPLPVEPTGTAPPVEPGPDLDCADIDGETLVPPDDPHNLDADGDGVGCDE